jgi:hypothetical protein
MFYENVVKNKILVFFELNRSTKLSWNLFLTFYNCFVNNVNFIIIISIVKINLFNKFNLNQKQHKF